MVETRQQRAAKEKETAATDSGKNSEVKNMEETKDASPEVLRTPKRVIVAAILLLIFSYVTMPDPLQPVGKPSVQHVWYYGWITALSTGLGVIPLVIIPDLDKFWVGVSNAIAAGMMVAASYSLFMEGCTFDEPDDISEISSSIRTAIGAALGLVFILSTKKFLEEHEEYTVNGLGGADARRALLIFLVMTLHSFSEGVGIGVSFGGSNGHELGVFISASLAVHNIPEGLAIAVVLLPQRNTKLTAALWAILTSIPQPIMAVPAYLFVHYFIPILPVGLGFAGGAMAWVALFELLGEAYEDTDMTTTGIISSISLAGMLWLQGIIDDR
jgi:ZIP family zinc transporter